MKALNTLRQTPHLFGDLCPDIERAGPHVDARQLALEAGLGHLGTVFGQRSAQGDVATAGGGGGGGGVKRGTGE